MMRHRVRYTATMDPATFARLERESGSVNRSRMIEAAVKVGLELLEEVKGMKERYEQAAKTRERNSSK